MEYGREEVFARSDLQIAYSKLSAEDREIIDRQAERLNGYSTHVKARGLRQVGELGALEILAALGR